MLLDFDPQVTVIAAQPFWLRWRDDAGRATRQFRRPLAWHIARRPGGVIAGALPYRHHAIHLFEGYAGTSDSGIPRRGRKRVVRTPPLGPPGRLEMAAVKPDTMDVGLTLPHPADVSGWVPGGRPVRPHHPRRARRNHTPGEIDITNAGQPRAALLHAAGRPGPAVVADMTRTRFCDSAGLHALIGAHRRARTEGCQVRLRSPAPGPPPHCPDPRWTVWSPSTPAWTKPSLTCPSPQQGRP
jgi:STAS domain